MPSPFPGMDPYLEHPEVWPGVHLLLIAALAESLTPQLRPKYAVSVEVRVYQTRDDQSLLVGIPDVTVQRTSRQSPSRSNSGVAVAMPVPVTLAMPMDVRQGYLEIREVATREVVTAIELLSPVNKRSGQGRNSYEDKRDRILGSSTHLVEVDLLRTGAAMGMVGQGIQSDYRVLVSRSEVRPRADLYPFDVQDLMPLFPVPLRGDDGEPVVDLKGLLDQVYDRAGYDLKLEYGGAVVPELAKTDRAWAEALLVQKGLR
jgi:hypothetical protein